MQPSVTGVKKGESFGPMIEQSCSYHHASQTTEILCREAEQGRMRTKAGRGGVFRPKSPFLDFCNTPELITALSQPCCHKTSPTTSLSCAQDTLSVSFPPASGQHWAGLGVSTWLQGLLSCSDRVVGSQNMSEREREREGVIDGLKMLDICMSAPWHLGKSQCKKNSSATVLLLHQTHFLGCEI